MAGAIPASGFMEDHILADSLTGNLADVPAAITRSLQRQITALTGAEYDAIVGWRVTAADALRYCLSQRRVRITGVPAWISCFNGRGTSFGRAF